MWRRRWPISSRAACWRWTASLARSCGSSRPISASIRRSLKPSSSCCRATPSRRARLARRHDARVKGRCYLKPGSKRKLRHTIEIRHDSFVTPDFIALLRRHRIGLVVADTVEWPLLMDVTSDFIYCRLHGSEELYASGYDDAALDRWADHIAAWVRGREHTHGRHASD